MTQPAQLGRLALFLTLSALAPALPAAAPSLLGGTAAASEYDEAVQRTKEEWQAFRSTLTQSKAKLEEVSEQYGKLRDAVESDNLNLALEILKKIDPKAGERADLGLAQLKGMIAKLDESGFTDKLGKASELLGMADDTAGKVQDAWEFAEKFDPSHAQDNPTYGLRLIGDILKEGSDKLKKVPLAGEILARWVQVYADASLDYANALDRISKNIRQNTRQFSLCADFGHFQAAQAAFAALGGGSCAAYFEVKTFVRLRPSLVFEGHDQYFLWDPENEKGYLLPAGAMRDVYKWHSLLPNKGRLYPNWLASRVNSLDYEDVARGRKYHRLIVDLHLKTDPAWVMMDALGATSDVEFFGKTSQDLFLAYYLLDSSGRSRILDLISQYEDHVYASGRVLDAETKEGVSGAAVAFQLPAGSYAQTTGSGGAFALVMDGKPGDAVSLVVGHPDYEPYTEAGGRFPERAILGWEISLNKPPEETTTAESDTTAAGEPDSTAAKWTITGLVVDAEGSPLPGASVSGGPSVATTGADGAFTIGPIEVTEEDKGVKSYDLAAAVKTEDGQSVTGAAVTVTYQGEAQSNVVLTVEVVQLKEVRISGTVLDANGIGLSGATVSGGGVSAVSGDGGAFTLYPVTFEKEGDTAVLSASYTDEDGNAFGGSPVTVAYEGADISGVTLVVNLEQLSQVTVSGTVIDADGKPIGGAAVSVPGASAVTDDAGRFTVGPIEWPLGKNLDVTASVGVEGGGTVSGRTSVAVKSADVSGALIRVEVTTLDEALEELAEEDREDGGDGELDMLLAAFESALDELAGLSADFHGYYDYFMQRMRELREGGCSDPGVAYALAQAGRITTDYSVALLSLNEVAGDIRAHLAIAADSGGRAAETLSGVESRATSASQEDLQIQSLFYDVMLGTLNEYACNADSTLTEGQRIAEGGADPDQVDTGGQGGGGVEVCGDGLDNDGDGEIDECDAGCCEGKNVLVIVSDCGPAADDIFLVAVDGNDLGLTPKGATNTFSMELKPGLHTVTVTTIDDGGDPDLPDDIGTFCLTVTVDGVNAVSVGETGLELGGSYTIDFTVPQVAAFSISPVVVPAATGIIEKGE